MLLKFKLENYRSYAKAAELSLLRGTKQRADQDDHRVVRCTPSGPDVLRAAAIFGPNAGGKSNLLKAIATLQSAVLRSAIDEAQVLKFESFSTNALRSQPVRFTVEFAGSKNQFLYRVDFFAGKVVFESLAAKALGAKASHSPMFQRTDGSIDFSGVLKDQQDLDLWRRNTRPHQLFLSQSQNLSAGPFLEEAFKWFKLKLRVVSPSASKASRYTADRLTDAGFKERLINELIQADLGVTDVLVSEETSQLSEFEKAPKIRVQFQHAPANGAPFEMDFHNESDGTQSFFSLLGPLDDVLQNDRVLIIDELDRSLHPLLVRRIVRAFASANSESQLLFSTHDATLLDADVLRRDQVWFAERDAQQCSSLRRLASGGVRLDKALMRAYLDGQFQGVPITDGLGVFGDA